MSDEEFLSSLKITPWPDADNYTKEPQMNSENTVLPELLSPFNGESPLVDEVNADMAEVEASSIDYQQEITTDLAYLIREFLTFSTREELNNLINQLN